MKKTKLRNRIIIAGIAASIIIILIIARLGAGEEENLVSTVDLIELAASDIEYTISATGTVESADSLKLYAGQNYRIEEVLVEVGDYVSVGDELLRLDTKSLEEQIETREISMGITREQTAQQIKTAEDNYNAARKAINDGTNSSLISAESSVRTSLENLERAKKTLSDYEENRKTGHNSTLISQDSQLSNAKQSLDQAQSAFDQAKTSRDNAKKAFDDYKPTVDTTVTETAYDLAVIEQALAQDTYDDALSAFQGAQSAFEAAPTAGNADTLNIARAALETAERLLGEARTRTLNALNAHTLALNGSDARKVELERDYRTKDEQLRTAEKSLEQARAAHDTAQKSRDAAYIGADTTLEDYKRAVETAEAAYETALRSYEAAEAAARTSLQQSRNSLESTRLGANEELTLLEYERLLRSLEEAKVVAKEEGTVTAVYATVGNTATGMLFVIEDTENLIIETTISEYDVGTVLEGMTVKIKSEATGDEVFDGQVLSIAPTSTKNAQGNTDRSGDASFAVKIAVSNEKTGLRIGMSTRLSFVVERLEEVFAVPYDAVYRNDFGQECIMVLDGDTLREQQVVTGLENDTHIVIESPDLREGITLVTAASNYLDYIGQRIALTDRMVNVSDNPFAGMMGF